MQYEQKQIAISVIMGVYNQKDGKVLEQAVDSIINQTFTEFEFLIYDDGSDKEETAALAAIAEKDKRIRLLRGETNHGLANALNECLKEAKGNYIARMDADDISAPKRFEKQKEFLDTHPEYAFVGSGAALFDENGVWGGRRMPEKPGIEEFLRYSPFIHPSVMFRRELLMNAGGYLVTKDTRRCEDYELFMRLYCMGQYGYNIPENLFYYRENRLKYDKRNFAMRISEMKIRYRGFRAMGILNIGTMIYVVKPVLLAVLPKSLRSRIRRRRMRLQDANSGKEN